MDLKETREVPVWQLAFTAGIMIGTAARLAAKGDVETAKLLKDQALNIYPEAALYVRPEDPDE